MAALAGKYDETRKHTLGPILDAFVGELKTKTVPALTRMGKVDEAIQLSEGAEKIATMTPPMLPREGVPFTPVAGSVLQDTAEWKAFVLSFSEAEVKLNEAYTRALDREKEAFAAKGDPYGLKAVENEAKRVDGMSRGEIAIAAATVGAPAPVAGADSPPEAKAMMATTAATGKKITRAQEKQIEEWLIGKMWQYERGNPEDHYFFRKDGEVVRDFRKPNFQVIKWIVEDDGTVNITGSGSGKWIWLYSETAGEMAVGTKDAARTPFLLVPEMGDPEKAE